MLLYRSKVSGAILADEMGLGKLGRGGGVGVVRTGRPASRLQHHP